MISAVCTSWDVPLIRELLFLSLDLNKAFDILNWNYLCVTLETLGFGPTFPSLLKTLYSSPLAQVSIRGYKLSPSPIRHGTRQGCPLSPLLFALAIEPLAMAIHSHPNIYGINCGQQEHKCALFADNVLMYITKLQVTLPNLLSLLDHFCNFLAFP